MGAWFVAGLADSVAIGAGIGESGWRLHTDLDRVGLVDLRTVQMAALIVLVVALGLALA